MAKVAGPLFSVEARGKLGSLCYNTWRDIHTVKTNSGPATQGTQKQIEVQDVLHELNSEWTLLTPYQRSLWDNYADKLLRPHWTGTPIRRSGFNWFVSCNYWRLKLDWPLLEEPTQFSPWYRITETSIEQAETTFQVALNGVWAYDTATWVALLWRKEETSPARNPSIKDAQYWDHFYIEEQPVEKSYDPSKYTHFWARMFHWESGIMCPAWYFKLNPYTP